MSGADNLDQAPGVKPISHALEMESPAFESDRPVAHFTLHSDDRSPRVREPRAHADLRTSLVGRPARRRASPFEWHVPTQHRRADARRASRTSAGSTGWPSPAANPGLRWHIANSPFYGGLQFMTSTWIGNGGRRFASRADLALPRAAGRHRVPPGAARRPAEPGPSAARAGRTPRLPSATNRPAHRRQSQDGVADALRGVRGAVGAGQRPKRDHPHPGRRGPDGIDPDIRQARVDDQDVRARDSSSCLTNSSAVVAPPTSSHDTETAAPFSARSESAPGAAHSTFNARHTSAVHLPETRSRGPGPGSDGLGPRREESRHHPPGERELHDAGDGDRRQDAPEPEQVRPRQHGQQHHDRMEIRRLPRARSATARIRPRRAPAR